MGYFSQRKKHERENIFLQTAAIVFSLFTVLLLASFIRDSFAVNLRCYLLQIYLIILLIFIYALYLGRLLYAFVFALLLMVNYTYLASFSNIFFNTSVEDEHHIAINYHYNEPLQIKAHGMVIVRSGHLNLGSGLQPQFVTFEKNQHVFTVIGVDFRNTGNDVRKKAFKLLRAFVMMQDDPVIVLGNFGEPIWSKNFKQFITRTGLSAKNRLLMIDEKHNFNPFAVPYFYVLAFGNVGINDLEVFAAPQNPGVAVELGFY